jgi:hypothetical protein
MSVSVPASKKESVMKRCALASVVVLAVFFVNAAVAQDDPGMPKEVVAYFESLVGEWKEEGRFLNNQFEGKVSIKWAEGRHCLVETGTRWQKGVPGVVSHGTSVRGWDPSTKEILQHSFFSGGLGAVTLRGKLTTPTRVEGKLVHALGDEPKKANFHLVEKKPGHWQYKSWSGDFVAAEFDFKKVDKE